MMDEDEDGHSGGAVEGHCGLRLLDPTGPQTTATVLILSVFTRSVNCGVGQVTEQHPQRCLGKMEEDRLCGPTLPVV